MTCRLRRAPASPAVWLGLAMVYLCARPAAARADRVLMLVVPGLSAREIASGELPALDRLVARSTVGWMNARTARVPGAEAPVPRAASYATIGAGSRAAAGSEARAATREAWERLLARNARLDHAVPIGALGSLAHAAGLTTAVCGADDDYLPDRAARLIAVDRAGRIDADMTDAPAWSERDRREPYGICSKVAAFTASPRADLDVRVFGDLGRAQRYAPLCVPAMADRHRRSALARLDAIVAAMADRAGDGLRVVLLSPATPDGAHRVDRLAPVLISGGGWSAGRLRSGSTHIPGLIASTDLLPTIAAMLGARPVAGAVGQPVSTQACTVTADDWARLHDRWLARARQQSAVGGLAVPQGLAALLAVFMLLVVARWPVASRHSLTRRALAAIALFLVALPLLGLLLPVIAPPTVTGAVAAMCVAAFGLVGFCITCPGRAFSLARAAALLTWLTIVMDALTGARLISGAWGSYSVMEGARYYGIGNEYAGAALASALLTCGPLLTRSMRSWALCVVALYSTALIVGAPPLGANAGGFVGCIAGFSSAALVWRRGRITVRDALGGAVLVGVSALGLLALDTVRGGAEQTHLGRALAGGFGELMDALTRKADLNIHLASRSVWSPALLCATAALALSARTVLARPAASAERRALSGTLTGALVGAIALLLANDSGVLAAAWALLPVSGWWLGLAADGDGIMSVRPRAADDRIEEATNA